MPATLEELSKDVLVPPPAQRRLLSRRPLDSVDLASAAGAEVAWDAESGQRLARYDSGETRSVSAAEGIARLRELTGEIPK